MEVVVATAVGEEDFTDVALALEILALRAGTFVRTHHFD